MKRAFCLLLLGFTIGGARASSDEEAIAVATRIVTTLSGRAPTDIGQVRRSTIADAPESFRGTWKEKSFDFRTVSFIKFSVKFPRDSTVFGSYVSNDIGNTNPFRQPSIKAGYKSIEALILKVADQVERCGITLPDSVTVGEPSGPSRHTLSCRPECSCPAFTCGVIVISIIFPSSPTSLACWEVTPDDSNLRHTAKGAAYRARCADLSKQLTTQGRTVRRP